MTEVLSAAGPTIRPLPNGTDRPATRPLTAVLAAIELGSASLAEVARATGLRHDVVEAAVDRLVRMGRLTTEETQLRLPTVRLWRLRLGDGGRSRMWGDPNADRRPRSGPRLSSTAVVV